MVLLIVLRLSQYIISAPLYHDTFGITRFWPIHIHIVFLVFMWIYSFLLQIM